MILYNNLIFFLGLKTWNIKESNILDRYLSQIKKEYLVNGVPVHNKIKLVKFFQTAGSPINSQEFENIKLEFNFFNKFLFYLYNFYSFSIFLLSCIQPIYLLYKMINHFDYYENYLIHLLLNINTPINYLWAKHYFKHNHFEHFIGDCQNITKYIIFVYSITAFSIIINFYNTDFFYNEYYFISYFNQYIAYTLIILEWVYTRLLYSLTISSFTLIFCKHLSEIKEFINKIDENTFENEDSYCLSKYIATVSYLRYTVEISCRFYNWILSFVTVTGGLSIGLYIRYLYKEYTDLNYIEFNNHEYYLMQVFSLFIVLQIIFFIIVIRYSWRRNEIKNKIQDAKFINQFLTRFSLSKIKDKCRDSEEIKYIAKLILCLEEENSSTIDWLILEKLTSDHWIDFSIVGISINDGSLIKKIIALSGILYMIFGHF